MYYRQGGKQLSQVRGGKAVNKVARQADKSLK